MLRGAAKSDLVWETGEKWGSVAADWLVGKFRGDEEDGGNIVVFLSEALGDPPTPRLTLSQH